MRTYVASINLTNLMKDKIATECWIILKNEIEGITIRCVPIHHQGKRSRKKLTNKVCGDFTKTLEIYKTIIITKTPLT